jgi:hypothetical protein
VNDCSAEGIPEIETERHQFIPSSHRRMMKIQDINTHHFKIKMSALKEDYASLPPTAIKAGATSGMLKNDSSHKLKIRQSVSDPHLLLNNQQS